MSVPSGFASNNIPTGVQIVGKPYDDNTVFKGSLADERAISWLFNKSYRPVDV
jgi:aspartyl-tRNA(Asn)/glutamyl-tRNA(Gln) amidotransferase subunit A